ncbi:hypothetical protein ABID39_001009 [Bartonella japonica]|uniref:Uncharacterized protein n=1 Tax=Bartonella japonica TaxID=357761 RepID=A0ABV2FPD3_9HYPH
MDTYVGKLAILEDIAQLSAQTVIFPDLLENEYGVEREFFRVFRQSVNCADQGASVFMV